MPSLCLLKGGEFSFLSHLKTFLLRISPIFNRHSFVYCVRILFGHLPSSISRDFILVQKRLSLTLDYIRILFVLCASRQSRVSFFFVFPR